MPSEKTDKLPLTTREKPHRACDWMACRKAYVERDVRPTLEELAHEFGGTPAKISRLSIEQSWAAAREARLARHLVAAEANQILLTAIESENLITTTAKTTSLELIRAVANAVPLAEKSNSPSSRATTLNTLGFALLNTCSAIQKLGIVGLPKGLEKAGTTQANGNQWRPELLQQINLTVHNLTSQLAKPDTQTPASAAPPAQPATTAHAIELQPPPPSVPLPPSASPQPSVIDIPSSQPRQ